MHTLQAEKARETAAGMPWINARAQAPPGNGCAKAGFVTERSDPGSCRAFRVAWQRLCLSTGCARSDRPAPTTSAGWYKRTSDLGGCFTTKRSRVEATGNRGSIKGGKLPGTGAASSMPSLSSSSDSPPSRSPRSRNERKTPGVRGGRPLPCGCVCWGTYLSRTSQCLPQDRKMGSDIYTGCIYGSRFDSNRRSIRA
jgi:hypothetical protein